MVEISVRNVITDVDRQVTWTFPNDENHYYFLPDIITLHTHQNKWYLLFTSYTYNIIILNTYSSVRNIFRDIRTLIKTW